MLGSGFGAAQAEPTIPTHIATTEQINLEEITNILETQTLVDIESQEQLTFVALEEQVLVLDETDKLVAIIGEELQQTAISEDVKVIPTELAQVQKLATDADSRLVIVQEQVLTVVDTEEIMTEQVQPQIEELTVVDTEAFWDTTTLQLRDATITTDKDVIALTENGKVHVFESLNSQVIDYQQIQTPIDLETVIANPIAIDELNDVVAIVDNQEQLVVIQTEELIEIATDAVIAQTDAVITPADVVITETTQTAPIDVEVAAVDEEIAKVMVIENEWVEKFSIEMIEQRVAESERILMTVSSPDNVELIVEDATPIAITLDQEKVLLALFADETIVAQFDDLAIELNQPTNEITSIVKIVRDETVAPISSCSVNIVDGQANYGQVTIGEIAETQFVLQTQGNPIVSVMGTEWTTAEDEVVMAAEQTHYELIATVAGEEPRLQVAYEEMTELSTVPVEFGQVEDVQELELFLQLQVPTTYDRESLDAQQTVAVFAEC
jgi:hypothetical protein